MRRPDRVRRTTGRFAGVALLVVGLAVALLTGSDAAAQSEPTRPVDPTVVRDQVRQVLARPEFSYEPSAAERVLDWFRRQLERLFGGPRVAGATGTFAGGIGALVAWLLIVAAAVALAVLVVRLVVSRSRRLPATPSGPLTATEVEHRRAADQWLADARRHEAAGEWKAAIRARYRHLVRDLVDRQRLPDVAGRTTGELRDDLQRSTPTASEDFDTCCLLFELPWYADVPTGAEENATFRAAAERVRNAPSVRPVDADLLPGSSGAGAAWQEEAESVGSSSGAVD